VSQANLSETSPLSGIAPGQAVMASWSREAMIRLHEER
jgi:putative spermidine/putrescine transport system ATP-binding protein